MNIAIIGWGSLVWDPRELPIKSGWKSDGPQLAVEFAHVSSDRRLTLVLDGGVPPVTTYWALSTAQTVSEAREQVRVREGTIARLIGSTPVTGGAEAATEVVTTIEQWRKRQGLDAAVWTNLAGNFAEKTGQPFTSEHVIRYLLSLPSRERRAAEEYIRRAPLQTQTPLRQIIEQRLGWRPLS